jgi:pimeloyl-ACP methyl ester carboxylesterase
MTGSLAAVLAPRLSVIRWDQRGCGRSERRGPYSVARCAAGRPGRRLDELCARARG